MGGNLCRRMKFYLGPGRDGYTWIADILSRVIFVSFRISKGFRSQTSSGELPGSEVHQDEDEGLIPGKGEMTSITV